MTNSNDLVIPAGIRLRIPSLLAFPAQVSCGEKPKATLFPFSLVKRCGLTKVNTHIRKEALVYFSTTEAVKSKVVRER